MKTDVIFRVLDREVIALFPAEPGTHEAHTCQSFMHIGQHGSADLSGVMRASRPATESEYAPLLAELRGEPYRYELRIVRRQTRKHRAARIAEVA